MSGGLQEGTRLYGLSFRPQCFDEAPGMTILEGSNVNATTALHSLHQAGFITACYTCCNAMMAIGVKYSQYKRSHLGTFLRKLSKHNLADEADIVI